MGPPGSAPPLDVALIAGEPSGDLLGADLMGALRARLGEGVSFRGVGGDAMVARGLASWFPMSDVAVMGYLPVLRRAPVLLRRVRQTVAALVDAPPDVLVIVDSPGLTHRVARRLRRARPGVRIVNYVSPTVWAWRPGRAKAMSAYVDHVLALLPFEPDAHRRLGGPPCTYVGHPLVERLGSLRPSPAEAVLREGPERLVLVMPGSRRSEVERLMGPFGEAAALAAREVPGLSFALPAVRHLRDLIARRLEDWEVPVALLDGEAAKHAAMRRARAALVASGTATLEVALAGVPMVVGYRVSRLESQVRHLITARFAALPNLVLDEGAVPELIQGALTPEGLAAALVPLLRGGAEREAQAAALARVGEAMAVPAPPSERAAGVVLDVLAERRARA